MINFIIFGVVCWINGFCFRALFYSKQRKQREIIKVSDQQIENAFQGDNK